MGEDFKPRFSFGQRIRTRRSGELGYAYDYEPGPGLWVICYLDEQGGCVIPEDELEPVEDEVPPPG